MEGLVRASFTASAAVSGKGSSKLLFAAKDHTVDHDQKNGEVPTSTLVSIENLKWTHWKWNFKHWNFGKNRGESWDLFFFFRTALLGLTSKNTRNTRQ